MKHSNEEKEGLHALIFAELKGFGVKVPKVKKSKPNGNKQEKNTTDLKPNIFGLSLLEQEWVSENGCTLPKFLAVSMAYLGAYTQVEIGLFRKAGSVARQRELRAKLEDGGNLNDSEPNDVASLLKQWLRELPEPIIPCYLHDLFIRCQSLEDEDVRLTAVLLSCFLLPTEHLLSLKHLIMFLSEIAANSEVNKMVPHNLAVIMAPNLLSSSSDRTDCKSGSNLVQCYTSLVELLILNAEKIGQIPLGISSKLSLKLEDFDISIDAIDFSPSKCKKKRRSGGVIDIMSGIRRLVGGNLTPITNSLEVPDVLPPHLKVTPAYTSETRSAHKRKADHDICPLTDIIKKKTLPEPTSKELAEIPLFTPVGKTARFVNSLATPITGFTPVIRNRRKSFGLLKKKQQKKAKPIMKSNENVKEINNLLSMQCNSACGENEAHDGNKILNKSYKVMDTLSVPKVVDISPVIISYNSSPFLRVKNPIMQRTQSDCLISSPKNEVVSFNKFLSASHEALPSKRLPCKQAKSSMPIKHRSPRKCISYDRFLVSGTKHLSPRKKDRGKHHDCRHHHQVSQKRNTIKGAGNTRTSSRKSPISNEIQIHSTTSALFVESTVTSPISNGKNVFFESNLISPENQFSEENLKREEKQHAEDASFNPDIKPYSEVGIQLEFKTPDAKVSKLPEISELKQDSPAIKLKSNCKKGLNKSSLKRGRPNTVKTGLPSDLCPKYSIESVSILKSDTISNLIDSKSCHQKIVPGNLIGEEFSGIEDNVFHDTDIKKNLNSEIEACAKEAEKNHNFNFFSTNSWLNLTPLESKQNDVSISFMDVCSEEHEIETSTYLNAKKVQSLDIKKKSDEKDSLCNSYYENRSEDLSESYSCENLYDKNETKIYGSSANETILTPSREEMQFKVTVNEAENLTIQISDKENDEIWMGAESFLKTHLQPITLSENPAACKRESILQLMVRNAGKVQESVQHYNYMSVGSAHCKSEEIPNLVSVSRKNSFSSPNSLADKGGTKYGLENISPCSMHHSAKSEGQLSRKRLQNLKINDESSLACSESKLNRIEKGKKIGKSPVQHFSKYVINSINPSQNRGCPLMEVTNTSVSKENLIFKKKSKIKSPTEIYNVMPVNKNRSLIHCSSFKNDSTIQLKNHSKNSSPSNESLKSMGAKCDSSPMLNKLLRFDDLLSKESSPGATVRPLQGHSQSFSTIPSHHTKKHSVSSLPCHSISNVLMNSSIQLCDEWACDM